ncbi:MAG TPA: cytochrome c family protein, partial [Parvularculaceae bacterium]|nr:cytochrome c family protein [Parvularculaceae bacterium]
ADPSMSAAQTGICKACHTFDKGGRTLIGPNLWGVVGRPKASMAGYPYSPALSGLGGAWTYEDLNKFLESPSSFASGTKMTFGGAKKPDERAAIIAFLRQQADSPAPLPKD